MRICCYYHHHWTPTKFIFHENHVIVAENHLFILNILLWHDFIFIHLCSSVVCIQISYIWQIQIHTHTFWYIAALAQRKKKQYIISVEFKSNTRIHSFIIHIYIMGQYLKWTLPDLYFTVRCIYFISANVCVSLFFNSVVFLHHFCTEFRYSDVIHNCQQLVIVFVS